MFSKKKSVPQFDDLSEVDRVWAQGLVRGVSSSSVPSDNATRLHEIVSEGRYQFSQDGNWVRALDDNYEQRGLAAPLDLVVQYGGFEQIPLIELNVPQVDSSRNRVHPLWYATGVAGLAATLYKLVDIVT